MMDARPQDWPTYKKDGMDMKTISNGEKRSRRLRVWELALLIGLAVFLLTGALSLRTQDQLADKVVRLHVLANSDSEEDQALKLKVRDRVLGAGHRAFGAGCRPQ